MDPYFYCQEDTAETPAFIYSNCWSESEFSKNSLTFKSVQDICQQTNEGEETTAKFNDEKDRARKMFKRAIAASSTSSCTTSTTLSVKSIATQTESDYDSESFDGSVISTTKYSNGVGSFRKISILLYMLLFLVLITPCGQPVDARLCMTDSKMLATTMTYNATEELTSSPVPEMQNMCMLADLDVDLPPETIVNTALISHPLYNSASSSRVTDLVPISSTEASLILHPKYSSRRRALIPVSVKDTALMVHPYFSTSTSRDLVVIPPRPILSCKIVSSMENYPSDIDTDSLLLITMLDRHIKNQDHRHCSGSEHPGIGYCDIDQEQQVATVYPIQMPDSWEDVKIDDKIEEIPTQECNKVDTPGLVLVKFGGNGDILVAAMVAILVFLYIKCHADSSSSPRNQGEYDCDAPPQQMIDETEPDFNDPITSCSNSIAKDNQLQQCTSTSDAGIKQSPVMHTSMLTKDSRSITDSFDSGFGSIQLDSSLPLPNQQFTSKSTENFDSGIGLEQSILSQTQSQQLTDECNEGIPWPSIDTSNHIRSLSDFSEPEELDDDDLTDVRDDIAHEAGLICLSPDQPMTLYGVNLDLECDTSSSSVSLDCEQFINPGILEEGPQEPSLLCPSMQNAASYDANLNDVVNQPNYNDINHSAMIFQSPASFNYNDFVYPRLEVEINMKLEVSETIHGVTVTVETSAVEDLCPLALPLKPPDININQPFIHQYEAHDYSAESVNTLQDYPNPVQARNGDPVDDALPHILADNHEDPDHNINENQVVPNVVPEFSEDISISSDAPNSSEDNDRDRFNPSLPEEGPIEPSLLSLSTQNATAQADQPISMLRGERDLDSMNGDQEQPSSESTENEQPTESNVLPIANGTPRPMPIIYDNLPYPHQENEIQVKLEATKDMQGAAVTVEDCQFGDLTSLVPPPRPPDININRLFVHHRGPPAVQFPNATQQNYPPPVQEAGHPLPTTSLLVGGISVTLPPTATSGQSRVILPSLHPRNYINSVVV